MKQEPKCVRLECQGQEDQCLPLPVGQARTALPSWTPGAGCAEVAGLPCSMGPWEPGPSAPRSPDSPRALSGVKVGAGDVWCLVGSVCV